MSMKDTIDMAVEDMRKYVKERHVGKLRDVLWLVWERAYVDGYGDAVEDWKVDV